MTAKPSLDRIVDRIRKLLALAQSSNVNEAAAAAAAAQKLMTEHQIEEALALAEDPDEPFDPIDDDMLGEISRAEVSWAASLAFALSTANSCETYTEWQGKQRVVRIVGPTRAAATVRYMFAYLKNEVNRLCDADKSLHGLSARHAFRLGAARAIANRVKSTAEVAMAAVEGNTAALARLDRSAEVEAAMPKGLISRRASTFSDRAAYDAGKRAGDRVALGSGPQLGAGAKGAIRG